MFTTNQCVFRDVPDDAYNLDNSCPNQAGGIEYVEFDSAFNTDLDIIVMDTGIDASHPEFDGITYEKIYEHESLVPLPDLHDHGTHIAGTNIYIFTGLGIYIYISICI